MEQFTVAVHTVSISCHGGSFLTFTLPPSGYGEIVEGCLGDKERTTSLVRTRDVGWVCFDFSCNEAAVTRGIIMLELVSLGLSQTAQLLRGPFILDSSTTDSTYS